MHTRAILVIDDEPDAILLLKRALAKAGVTNPVHDVNDGDQALAYLKGEAPYSDRSAHPLPHWILLDLKLPRLSGLQVLQWIKSQPQLRCLPIVVLTSSKEKNDVQAAYLHGANSYLVKPASLHALTAVMEAFRAYWLGHNEPPEVTA